MLRLTLIYFIIKFRPNRDEAVQQYTEKEGSTTMVNIGRMEKIFAPLASKSGPWFVQSIKNESENHGCTYKTTLHLRWS